MDTVTTIDEIRQWIKKFDDDRDWHQYHHPKELSISISLEASELLEHFQWEKRHIDDIKSNSDLMNSIQQDLADIIIYCFNFANQLDIDISDAIKDKIGENDRKYPVKLVKGKSEKYTQYRRNND